MTATDPAAPGQTVIYHGSIAVAHGPATFIGVCEPCGDCTALLDRWSEQATLDARRPPMRYVLQPTGYGLGQLTCVRPESFTAVVADEVALAVPAPAAGFYDQGSRWIAQR